VKVAGTDKTVPWFQMALAAYTAHNLPAGMEPGLKEGAFYDPANFTFPAGCYICEVEVDPETGKTKIVQFVAADDFGNIINPMIVEGQVHGGIAQGIGQALLEGVHYDASGQLLTASYMDYTMPRADDLPSFKISHQNTPCPGNPLGIKGCGEAGAIGSPPAVINAITDAIGNNDLTMPATPQKVWSALKAATALRRTPCTHQLPSRLLRRRRRAKLLKKAEDGKLVSGGMTLIPAMKTRLAAPSDLVDLRHVPALKGITVSGKTVRSVPATTHAEVATSGQAESRVPGDLHLASHIGDPHVRHMGTIGGSIANNDPAADYPAACWRSGATIVTNKREIAADNFFTGLFETALKDDEIVDGRHLHAPAKCGYAKFPNPASRYAMTGVFVAKTKDGVRVAVTGAGDEGVFRAKELEAALSKSFDAAALDGVSVSPKSLMSDMHASSEYRANLVVVMAKRAVASANI
jgi:CO/xanthine dehydrogenase FAD-binding subunit